MKPATHGETAFETVCEEYLLADLTGFTVSRGDLDSVNQRHADRSRFCGNLSGLDKEYFL